MLARMPNFDRLLILGRLLFPDRLLVLDRILKKLIASERFVSQDFVTAARSKSSAAAIKSRCVI